MMDQIDRVAGVILAGGKARVSEAIRPLPSTGVTL